MASPFPRSARTARRGAAQRRTMREVEARQRELDRLQRRLPATILVKRHAIERWRERVDPSLSAGAAEGQIAAFVRRSRVIGEQPNGNPYLSNPAYPGIRLVVAPVDARLHVVTVHFDPALGAG